MSGNVSAFKQLKFVLIRIIRAAGLLKLADTLRYYLRIFASSADNKAFLRGKPGFVPPPSSLAFDAYNHVNWRIYEASGAQHAGFFTRTILEHHDADKLKVLEWGCGPGRIIRHIPGLLGDRCGGVSGSDYNPQTIDWCRANLGEIEFVLNGLHPPLAFESNTFDVVYNFSVFTHLSKEAQLAWADELHRVLKPGGILVCTTHGENYLHLLSSEQERAEYDAGEVVIQAGYKEGGKWYFATHPHAFVKSKLLKSFEEVKFVETLAEDELLQDVWVARKAEP